MNKKEVVLVEATRVVDRWVTSNLRERHDVLMEIIKKGDSVNSVDVGVARQLIKDINCFLRMMLGDGELFESERYHLYQDPNGWLSLVRGVEIEDG